MQGVHVEHDGGITKKLERRTSSGFQRGASNTVGQIAIVTPRRMMEVDDEVAIVGRGGFGERDAPDPCPVLVGEPLNAREAMFFSHIGYGDVEDELPTTRERIIAIVEDAQDFITEIDP